MASMKDHHDADARFNLMRLMGAQTEARVGLVDYATVQAGAAAVTERFEQLKRDGARYAVTDAVTNADLMVLGEAVAGHVLLTGGSGIAMGLPRNFVHYGLAAGQRGRRTPVGSAGARGHHLGQLLGRDAPAVGCAGGGHSCAQGRSRRSGRRRGRQPLRSPIGRWPSRPTSPSCSIRATIRPRWRRSRRLGREEAGALVEQAFAEAARLLVAAGVAELLVAGGETSGAVAQGLGIRTLEIGPEIDPGVPWTRVVDGPDMVVALKSGNFGAPDFFVEIWALLG